jgi:hypothetical protein
MIIMAGTFVMIGLFALGNDICRAAQIIAAALLADKGIKEQP